MLPARLLRPEQADLLDGGQNRAVRQGPRKNRRNQRQDKRGQAGGKSGMGRRERDARK
jgi:hypothetical protein